MKFFLITVVKFYRYFISPMFTASCRFHPTCSAYMIEAIEKHGAFKGAGMGIRRILKCHPYYKGNSIDPVKAVSPKSIATRGWFGYKRK